MPVERVCISAMSEHRRASKPIMEKRRRARINNSLTELKTLILDATRKDCSRQSKLEKADILEMTVKHLQNVQRQQMAAAVSHDPTVLTKFKGGFTECAAEISRYLNSMEGVDKNVRQRILAHLGQCLNGLHNYLTPLAFGPPSVAPAFFHNSPPQHLLPHLRNVPMAPVMMQSRPQHFFPTTLSPLNVHPLNETQNCRASESPCSSPASPFGSTGSSLPPTTPYSPMSTCSKMSEAESVWRPW